MTIRHKIFNIIDYREENKNKVAKLFNYFMLILIILNLFLIIIDTMQNLSSKTVQYLNIIETISTIIFTLEYIARLLTADILYQDLSKPKALKKYIFSGMALVDLLSIIPFYLPFIIPINLSVLRSLRLFRIVRLMKINRYTKAMKNVAEVINNKKYELISSFIVIIFLMMISSIIMFNVESKAQPEVFSDALDSLWWATATLTTVGYGDIYPITILGRLLSSLISLFGIGLVAIPTGIISSGFVEMVSTGKDSQELKTLQLLLDKKIINEDQFREANKKL